MSAKIETAETALESCLSISELRCENWRSLVNDLAQLAAISPSDFNDATFERVLRNISTMSSMELYWAFPGALAFAGLREMIERRALTQAHVEARWINAMLAGKAYRHQSVSLEAEGDLPSRIETEEERQAQIRRPYFEALFVGEMLASEQETIRQRVKRKRGVGDPFVFDAVFVPSFEDALNATLLNADIQAVVIYDEFAFRSQTYHLNTLGCDLNQMDAVIKAAPEFGRAPLLGRKIAQIRPELGRYLVTGKRAEDIAARSGDTFHRAFCRYEDDEELYSSIMHGVAQRCKTPYFDALRDYSKRPVVAAHAPAAQRGKSLMNSDWVGDCWEFYGENLFRTETSATIGGLDDLFHPTGPLKLSQENAARAFGAMRTSFVTAGTSAANRIVLQALVGPDDMLLVDRNCHKSIHYGLMPAGARVHYLDPYPLNDYSIYGAVPVGKIKQQLLAFKRDGTLDRLRLLALTNCTFDGVAYNVERVTMECLAIAPHLTFLWDEAWFAFGYFHPVYRQRTAMGVAAKLSKMLQDPDYAARYEAFSTEFDAEAWNDDERVLNTKLLPDPSKARVRVYSTQSTHKTLTALRQGSMIHGWDQDFCKKTEETFQEAYMMHLTTSPNSTILALLDVGRKQAELEGYKLTDHATKLANTLRALIRRDPLLNKYYEVLDPSDLIPPEYRESNAQSYSDERTSWSNFETTWRTDEFALVPTHVTVSIGRTGMDGSTFRKLLMDKYDIQINKTTRNSVLFLITIGATHADIAHYCCVLREIALDVEHKVGDLSTTKRCIHDKRVNSLTLEQPSLPEGPDFHRAFRGLDSGVSIGTGDGDIRSAFYKIYDAANCEYLHFDEAKRAIAGGRTLTSARFVIPYPPGWPVLTPGQEISPETVEYLRAIGDCEIHGFRLEEGLQVLKE
ncbi:aminotransferase class I/II-fold pyridoxal phosphate-dependent enzyme [Rhizobium leguminosarum]|uniref:aminotransferase class I/II-fold pyridoxal phosphate-dependent enzyme n=1 Tax=Rhizobium leguminosarum TaxID=384 RepID=UPI001AE115A0|nr:ornithine decarboxylase [Rhizobium leguminosarum]MBP2444197.1 arginine decarboxylase [Rhizobium leguminosarum]